MSEPKAEILTRTLFFATEGRPLGDELGEISKETLRWSYRDFRDVHRLPP